MHVPANVHLADPVSPAPRGICWKLIYDPVTRAAQGLPHFKGKYPQTIQEYKYHVTDRNLRRRELNNLPYVVRKTWA